MLFLISSFILGINTQSLFEYFEHLLHSSFHTSTTKDSLLVYSNESTNMLICVLLNSLEAISTHGAHAFTLFDHMSSLCFYMIICTHPLYVNEFGYLIHSLGLLFHLFGDYFIFYVFEFQFTTSSWI